jgi:hypothetical protein
MRKQSRTKSSKRTSKADPLAPLQAALKKRTKDELIEVVLEFAGDNRARRRELETRFGVEPANEALVAETRQAIVDATDFDERQVNYNFDYDYGAYETVKRNFGRMVKAGQLEPAMELAVELMRSGSYQVEMSDEGMMADDVAGCLQVVLRAVAKSKLPPARIVAWCSELENRDRVGFILNKEISAVRKQFEMEG